jgi:hypothetical protein
MTILVRKLVFSLAFPALMPEYVHLLVEIPKEAPFKGCWVEIVAENWVKEDILYIPDNSYSSAYKRNMLIGGAEPVVES